jgi:hypothetical protein
MPDNNRIENARQSAALRNRYAKSNSGPTQPDTAGAYPVAPKRQVESPLYPTSTGAGNEH